MRVSEFYHLTSTQASLEFVDVKIDEDSEVFIDPRAIGNIDDEWADEASYLIQNFFATVLDYIRAGEHTKAQTLLSSLSEPNETRLGHSKGRPSGRGMGDTLAYRFWLQLTKSKAVSTGLVQDLEDTALFVEGIDKDIISDITTNIIRRPLVDFTQSAARYHGITLVPAVAIGYSWNPIRREWTTLTADLPIAGGEPLLLVPKVIVKRKTLFNSDEYWRYHVAPYLQQKEMSNPIGSLQEVLGRPDRVTKKYIQDKYGKGKKTNLDASLSDPSILEQFRSEKSRVINPLDDVDLSETIETPVPDYQALMDAVAEVPAGAAGADAYHRAIESLLTALFHPALAFPKREFPINDGRKRIDIQYTNVAEQGFFEWLHRVAQVPCAYVPVECKNYSNPVGNPEFDQLAGRFSMKRGKLGILCYRGFQYKNAVIKSCRDTALDDRGWILPLDDEDLQDLVNEKVVDGHSTQFKLLRDRYAAII